jgi:hypothetical protein
LDGSDAKKTDSKTNWFQEERYALVAFTQIPFFQQIRRENSTGTYLTAEWKHKMAESTEPPHQLLTHNLQNQGGL